MTDLQIFKNAPQDASADELKSYLDEACGGDATLRSRVEALFQAEAKAGGFMKRPAADGLMQPFQGWWMCWSLTWGSSFLATPGWMIFIPLG